MVNFCSVDISLLSEMSKIQKMAVVPILSLLESSVEDTALCHNSLMLLIQVRAVHLILVCARVITPDR